MRSFFLLLLWKLHAASFLFLDVFGNREDVNQSLQAHSFLNSTENGSKSLLGNHSSNATAVLGWDEWDGDSAWPSSPSHHHVSNTTFGSGKLKTHSYSSYSPLNIYLRVAFSKSLIIDLKWDAIWGQCSIFHWGQLDQRWALSKFPSIRTYTERERECTAIHVS